MSQRLLAVLLVVLVAVQSQYGRPAEAFTAGAGNIGNRKRMETVKDEAVRNDRPPLVTHFFKKKMFNFPLGRHPCFVAYWAGIKQSKNSVHSKCIFLAVKGSIYIYIYMSPEKGNMNFCTVINVTPLKLEN